MARQSKIVDEAETPVEQVTETVTYTPGPMDPSTVKWAGHTFQANVPKDITGHADGTEREKLNHHLIERARENKHFTVGSARRPRRDADALPKTSEEYKAYMVGWLKDPEIASTDQLIARFARDHDLQVACEVGHDDFSYLSTLFMPRLHELARADELSDPQVASIWISHGVNQLPWSS
jgi:hypothetical protein